MLNKQKFNIESAIDNTPIILLKNYSQNRVFAKIEGANFFGSMKDRSANYVLKELLKQNVINSQTTIIESTSGNMGVALAGICNQLNLKIPFFLN